jgi:hypothetical protein
VRSDATSISDTVDPCGQATGDRDQRSVSIDRSSVDSTLRGEVVDRCGHEDIVTCKRDR